MYSFKIVTPQGRTFHGLSAELGDLENLIAKKAELDNIEGDVTIFKGKKIFREYNLKIKG